MTDPFPTHSLATAPQRSRAPMESTIKKIGFLAEPVARLATSPETLQGFLQASALFEASSLEPMARESVIMTVAVRNSCHVCVEMHSGILARLGATDQTIQSLRCGEATGLPAVDSICRFTAVVLDHCGAVPEQDLQQFLDAGYSARNALEVVLGIGAYTISTLANRLTGASLAPVA